jgi:hypothetical protein
LKINKIKIPENSQHPGINPAIYTTEKKAKIPVQEKRISGE